MMGRRGSALGLVLSWLTALFLLAVATGASPASRGWGDTVNPGSLHNAGPGDVHTAEQGGPLINEVITRNATLLSDTEGDNPDIIELYNPGPEAILLDGYGLSDDPAVPLKWTFPAHVMEPESYLLVLAGKGRPAFSDNVAQMAVLPIAPTGILQIIREDVAPSTSGSVPRPASSATRRSVPVLDAPFGLSHRGDRLTLSDPQGQVLQMLLLDAAAPDSAYGRNGTGDMVWFVRGTPGRQNAGAEIRNMKSVQKGASLEASHASGFFPEPFDLVLASDRPELTIRYTLDGSLPDAASTVYESPLPIRDRAHEPYRIAGERMTFAPARPPSRDAVNLATVVVAQAFDGETPIGQPLYRTFLVTPEGEARYTLPVVSLVTDPAHLFDDTYGIFAVGSRYLAAAPRFADGSTPANYNQRGREWERPIHMELILDGEPVFSQSLGARTFGAWSRAELKKSLKLFARKDYTSDTNTMAYAFFPGLNNQEGAEIDSFRRLVLRNGGNDWNTTLFRDPLMQGLADDVAVKQASRPVVVFLNGEYWGVYFLTESMDATWVAAHFGVSADSVGIVANAGELYEGTQADVDDYASLMAYVEQHSLASSETFNRVAEWVDIEAYLRYQAAQIYFGNLDWPGNNFRMFRVRPDADEGESGPEPVERGQFPSDGRWRPMLFDTDFGFGLYEDTSDVTHDTLWLTLDPTATEWPNPPWSTLLFRRLMENDACRRQFVAIMEEALQTRFSTETVLEAIHGWEVLLTPEMEEYAGRYPLWRIPDMDTWKREGIAHLEAYARLRPHQIRKQLERHLGEP